MLPLLSIVMAMNCQIFSFRTLGKLKPPNVPETARSLPNPSRPKVKRATMFGGTELSYWAKSKIEPSLVEVGYSQVSKLKEPPAGVASEASDIPADPLKLVDLSPTPKAPGEEPLNGL